MTSFLVLAFCTVLTLLGDYCIKLSTETAGGLRSPMFILGALFYGIPALGWFYLMSHHSLASVGVFYSAATIVFLAGLGVIVFKEPLGWRDMMGLFLAVAAVFMMSASEV